MENKLTELRRFMKSHDLQAYLILKAVEKNLVDEIWLGRPAPPSGPLILHDEKYAGESVGRKLERLRLKLTEEAADAHVLTQLDAIAWLFNIRGSDVEYNPVAIAYAIVTREKAALFVDFKKVSAEIKKELHKEVEIFAYFSRQSRMKQRLPGSKPPISATAWPWSNFSAGWRAKFPGARPANSSILWPGWRFGKSA